MAVLLALAVVCSSPLASGLAIVTRSLLVVRGCCPIRFARGVIHNHLIVLGLVSGVIDAQDPSQDRSSPQVIHGEISAALIFILEEGEASGLARLFVPHQIHVRRLAELREDGNHVAFGEIER